MALVQRAFCLATNISRGLLRNRCAPIGMVAIILVGPVTGQGSSKVVTIRGVVLGPQGPIPGATVRQQASQISAITDATGSFILAPTSGDDPVVLTAWAPGYYIGGGVKCHPGDRGVQILLDHHCETDHRDYQWVSAFSRSSGEEACQSCHAASGDTDADLLFDQWRLDAHANTVSNPRFLTMYLGTDITGNRSPQTRYQVSRDYGSMPIRPSTNRPYYGPGFKLDNPSTAGNCATCHAPMAATDTPYGVDPSALEGVETEGIGCDFCHKIWRVVLDPVTALPYDNRPGVLSYVLRRPGPEHQLFTGPFDDVAPGEDVCSPIQRESRYCAPCHSARFWGIQIYNSYGEWLESPYSDPQAPMTCQDCHMPSDKGDHFARLDKGGKIRDPKSIFSHRMPGAGDSDLLQNAVTMTATADVHSDTLIVRVKIVNDNTGHHVPTDSPLRQMILVVEATDDLGDTLNQCGGPKLPEWCGIGNQDKGYVAGRPGTAFAKVLEELWTGVYPTGAYWNHTRIRSDNRIAAMDSDETSYSFDAPSDGKATVDVRLLYRRAFIELRDLKGWTTGDIEMERKRIVLDASAELEMGRVGMRTERKSDD